LLTKKDIILGRDLRVELDPVLEGLDAKLASPAHLGLA
jgi:hypothetical protein